METIFSAKYKAAILWQDCIMSIASKTPNLSITPPQKKKKNFFFNWNSHGHPQDLSISKRPAKRSVFYTILCAWVVYVNLIMTAFSLGVAADGVNNNYSNNDDVPSMLDSHHKVNSSRLQWSPTAQSTAMLFSSWATLPAGDWWRRPGMFCCTIDDDRSEYSASQTIGISFVNFWCTGN